MNGEKERIPPAEEGIILFRGPELDSEAIEDLLAFHDQRHRENLAFFLYLRERWHRQNPGRRRRGLCADVNPITGEFRPEPEQRLWGWGDGRALGTWSSFLTARRVPDEEFSLPLEDGASFATNLAGSLGEYVDVIYQGLRDRLLANDGVVPFTADPGTDLADGNPKNAEEAAIGGGNARRFAADGFLQYGMYRSDADAFALGMELLCGDIETTQELSDYGSAGERYLHGTRMIAIGNLVNALKTMAVLEGRGDTTYSKHREDFVRLGVEMALCILDHHYGNEPPRFWEYADSEGRAFVEADGCVVVDPGHATELAGFLAELVPFVRDSDVPASGAAARILEAATEIHLFADSVGFAPTGVMFKYVDLNTGEALPDTQAGVDFPTAPWWNIREHCAAALKLYTLTRDRRLLESYRKAQVASYLHYPNLRIAGQMVQTLDPFTLKILDIRPATGNLDPMHDPRARVRETECLESLRDEKGE